MLSSSVGELAGSDDHDESSTEGPRWGALKDSNAFCLPFVLAEDAADLVVSEYQRLAQEAQAAVDELKGVDAKMRDEITGQRLFRDDEIPENIVAKEPGTAMTVGWASPGNTSVIKNP
eukprot:Skav233029  [mRNA]  locus=scaffold909:783811:788427:- [translate_table: standard]